MRLCEERSENTYNFFAAFLTSLFNTFLFDSLRFFCRTLVKCVPKRALLLALTCMAGGLYCKFFWEKEGEGTPEYTQADYSIPHSFWHVGVFGACLPISWVAIEFNLRCFAVWGEEVEDDGDNGERGVELIQADSRENRKLSTESSGSLSNVV